MNRTEFKKVWSSPLILISLLLVCLFQFFYVLNIRRPNSVELASAMNAIGGSMNEEWRESINQEYNSFSQTIDPDEYYEYSIEERALINAHYYTSFTEMLDQYVNVISERYGEQATESYASLREASENGELIFGSSPAGEIMRNQSMITWGFLLFMMLLCMNLFSQDYQSGMTYLQSVTKNGRNHLLKAKLFTCQISAMIVWVLSNLSYALSLNIFCGWGNHQSVLQDFNFYCGPYVWTTGQYLLVTLLFGFLASQLTAFVMFLLAYLGKNSIQKSFVLLGSVMILPYLLAGITQSIWFYSWTPCLINNEWLWDSLILIQIGKWSIPYWSLTLLELLIVFVASTCLFRHITKTMNQDIYRLGENYEI